MTITAWYMDSSDEDKRQPHVLENSPKLSREDLDKYGVLSWTGLKGEDDEGLAKIKKDRGYTYTDTVTISPDKLPEYEKKLENFFKEHIHYDEEIRFCLEGSGYFDIRDENDKWIRISCQSGDLIILPEGMYHRFTLDENNYGKFQRLFVGEPVWTPYNRDEIDEMKNASRIKYEEAFLNILRSKRAKVEETVIPPVVPVETA